SGLVFAARPVSGRSPRQTWTSSCQVTPGRTMAGEAAKTENEAPSGKPGGLKALLGKLPVLVGGVMVVEAVILFAGFKMFGGGPGTAEGADTVHGDPAMVDGHETFDAPLEMVEV